MSNRSLRHLPGLCVHLLVLIVFVVASSSRPVSAQLAITEAMSSESNTYQGTNIVTPASDWWELTNFGTNAIDLAGYWFTDLGDSGSMLVGRGQPPLSLEPNQSVIFVRVEKATTNEAQFLEHWSLPYTPLIRFYGTKPGLNSKVEAIKLYDSKTNLVECVNFGPAQPGLSFTSDNNGEFGVYSERGVCGSVWAAKADDLGSPGVTCGPIPLRFLAQPTNQTACAGTWILLASRAAGLPRPRYQWFFNGKPITNANSPCLTLAAITPKHAGEYVVQINNGLASSNSLPAQLTVSTNPLAPFISAFPRDTTVLAGKNACFKIEASGYPPPSYQWFSNSVVLPGEESPTLLMPNCCLEMSGTTYSVEITNAVGCTNSSARLTVIPPPQLEVTEAMGEPLPGTNTQTWFELTNFDTNAVNLFGWRFLDGPNMDVAFTINQQLIIEPGESIICVKRLNRDGFAAWWGPDNLPPRLKVVTWEGFGISQNESLHIWPCGAVDPVDDLYRTFSFSWFATGVSLWLDPTSNPCGSDSQIGERGAFYALASPDLGSPGYVGPPSLEFIGVDRVGSQVSLKWRSIPGKSYRLLSRDALTPGAWSEAGRFVATNATTYASDWLSDGPAQTFYRVQELP